jgi:sugar-phosphatase
MPSFSCEAILFDLDGVLVDSTPIGTRIWTDWAKRHGLDAAYVVHVGHGRPTAETVRHVAPHLDAQREAHDLEAQEIADVDDLQVIPGARELLASLPVERFAIVTSGGRRLATARLQAVGLAIPPTMITADDITRGKPDPSPYLLGSARLGFDPATCLVFEDAPSGVQAAKAAAMHVIAIPTTYRREELAAADLIISSLLPVRAHFQPLQKPALHVEIALAEFIG